MRGPPFDLPRLVALQRPDRHARRALPRADQVMALQRIDTRIIDRPVNGIRLATALFPLIGNRAAIGVAGRVRGSRNTRIKDFDGLGIIHR